jgi:hypothetical protein
MIPALLFALTSLVGVSLPAETLSEKPRVFPRDAAGPRAVFVVTFSKAASAQGSEWTRRLREKQAALAAPVYQVAVLEGAPRFVRSMVVSALRRDVPKGSHDQFWIVTANTKEWQRCVDSTSADEAHVFLLEKGNRIVWRTRGNVSDARIEELLAVRP